MNGIIKFHKVDSSVNDVNVVSYVNMDYVLQWVTAATTVIITLKGMDTDVEIMDDTITITTAAIADTRLVADGLHALMNGPYNAKAVRAIGAGFNGASITTITVATAA